MTVTSRMGQTLAPSYTSGLLCLHSGNDGTLASASGRLSEDAQQGQAWKVLAVPGCRAADQSYLEQGM